MSPQQRSTSSRPWLSLVLCIIGTGVWIFATGQSLSELILSVQSRNWPSTQGQVAWLDIRSVSGKTGTTYFPQILYQYTVDGNTYKNDTLRFSYAGVNSRSEAERVLSSYTVGETILVYYKPGNPQLACLEPGGPYMRMIGSLLFGIVAILGCVWLTNVVFQSR